MSDIPALHVQQMGKKFRIAYVDTRTLARLNSGEPADGGGFEDVWEDGEKIVDGRLEAMKKLSEIQGDHKMIDPEEEGVGH